MSAPDPSAVHSLPDLVREIDHLRRRPARGSGTAKVGIDALARRTGLPRSTLHAYVSGVALAPPEALDRIVIALDCPTSEVREWAEAWFRVAASIDQRRHG